MICEEFLNFLYVLIDKGRTMHLAKIIKVYKSLMEKEEGYSYGTVYSVVPLDKKRIERAGAGCIQAFADECKTDE